MAWRHGPPDPNTDMAPRTRRRAKLTAGIGAKATIPSPTESRTAHGIGCCLELRDARRRRIQLRTLKREVGDAKTGLFTGPEQRAHRSKIVDRRANGQSEEPAVTLSICFLCSGQYEQCQVFPSGDEESTEQGNRCVFERLLFALLHRSVSRSRSSSSWVLLCCFRPTPLRSMVPSRLGS